MNELFVYMYYLLSGETLMGMSDPVKRDLIFASLNIAKGLQVYRHDYQYWDNRHP